MYFETSTSNPESIRTAFTQLISSKISIIVRSGGEPREENQEQQLQT